MSAAGAACSRTGLGCDLAAVCAWHCPAGTGAPSCWLCKRDIALCSQICREHRAVESRAFECTSGALLQTARGVTDTSVVKQAVKRTDQCITAVIIAASISRGMPSQSSISREAALTILLHAAKFPAAAVNGVLLGTVEPGSEAVTIQAAVPLLHTFLTLAPSLETALFLVRCMLHTCATSMCSS